MKIKVANRETMLSDQYIPALELWVQGFTFYTDLRLLQMAAYDAILGYDWLKKHSPMICHWEFKTLEFVEGDQQVHLEGVKIVGTYVSSISPEQVVKWHQGNDIWAMAVAHQFEDPVRAAPPPDIIEIVLSEFQDVFAEPTSLPPHREYDHTVPLVHGSVPINAKPYRYSPLYKDEIEKEVRTLLQNGLIVPSSSPFASPVLLVQKKDGSWHFCVDYRRLNSITIKIKFPMPLIDEILDELAGSTLFSTLDFQGRLSPDKNGT
jgi:hypothetical protein